MLIFVNTWLTDNKKSLVWVAHKYIFRDLFYQIVANRVQKT